MIKPINTNKMEAPKINEYWHVAYGMKTKTNIIVHVTENKKEFDPPNWRCNNFDCEHIGDKVSVSGEAFIERFL